ncbi:Histone deacetylase HDT4 [Hirschfeldia incana]|nr:Histone deacetylase HDT4 [Hirschfeldia incana]
MEFWGIEIKPGKPTKVEQEDGYMIHVTQIAIGEFNKVGDKTVQVFVKVGGDDKQKILIGNLSQKVPQVSLDLLFEQDFEISHECKSTSVYLIGYKSPDPMDGELNSDFDSEDEDIPMDMFKSELEKSKASVEAGESESDDEDESDSDEMGSDEDEDEDDSEEEEDTPVKVEPPSKKRPNGGAVNNNNAVASKKAKVANQQKPSGGHKGQKCGVVRPPKRN